MGRALRFGFVAMLLGTLAMSFLGVVSFQNGDAMSTMHQRGVIKSFHKVLVEEIDGKTLSTDGLSQLLGGHSILRSPDVTALVVDDKGRLTAGSWEGPIPGHAQKILERWQRNPAIPDLEKRVDIDMARFVWFDGQLPGSDHTLLLVHECKNVPFLGLTDLYILPIGLGILMIVWFGFWATVISTRLIRQQDRAAEMELELVRQEEANRIKSAFFANMSHELRTPLNAVIGFSELLKGEVFGPLGNPRNLEYVKDIHDAGKSLLSLIGNILDFSNIEAGETKLNEAEVDLDAVIDGVAIGNGTAIAEKNITLRRSLGNLNARLRGDQVKVERALCNLVHNSVTYTDENGVIDVDCRVDGSGQICISIRDYGCGLKPEALQSLLSGHTHIENNAHHSKDGPGLGIPLSRSLIELHGGTFDMESELGKGTTVKITFPAERTLPDMPGDTKPDESFKGEPLPQRLAS